MSKTSLTSITQTAEVHTDQSPQPLTLPPQDGENPSNQAPQGGPSITLNDDSDASISDVFIAKYGKNHHYISDEQHWITWDAFSWHAASQAQPVMNDLDRLRAELAANRSLEIAKAKDSAIRKLSSNGSKKSILKFLEQKEELVLNAHDLDSRQHLISFINAVFSTKTHQLFFAEEQIRPLLLTKRMNVKYDEDATCPTWLEFLSTIFEGDQDLMDFIQKAAALSLSGDVREELLFFAVGSGANGKTTFFEVLSKIFGDFYVEIDPSVFTKSVLDKSDKNAQQHAELEGKRFATSNEIAEHSVFNELEIKRLCSRDQVTCRKLYGSPRSFTPSHKLWIRSNHKPRFNITDDAMLRRIVLIPFSYTIPLEQRKMRYEDVLLREKSGILNWLLYGWSKYQAEGLTIPESCQHAMREYVDECDILSHFMQECATTDPDAKILLKDLKQSYNYWASENAYKPINSRTLSEQLRHKDIIVKSGTGNQITAFGIKLNDPETDPTETQTEQ